MIPWRPGWWSFVWRVPGVFEFDQWMLRFSIWRGKVWCAMKGHHLRCAEREGFHGHECVPCERWEAEARSREEGSDGR